MANQKIIEAKSQVVDEITDVAKNNASFILFDYRGLTAEETTELRKILRDSESSCKIWKNTLTKRAMDNLNYDLGNCLEGPSAIAYSTDAVAPIKVLSNFAKEHPALEIKGGIVDGKVTSLEDIKALSNIPSREVLLGQLVGLLTSPIRSLAFDLSELAKQKA